MLKSCLLGRKVICVRCINCSYNNITKRIRLLDKTVICVYTGKKILQVRAFESNIPKHQYCVMLLENFSITMSSLSPTGSIFQILTYLIWALWEHVTYLFTICVISHVIARLVDSILLSICVISCHWNRFYEMAMCWMFSKTFQCITYDHSMVKTVP